MATLLATGAFLKNSALLWQHGRWQASAPHGDLSTAGACMALEASVDALLDACGRRIDAVAHDLHPDFHSTRVAWAVAARLGVPAIGVQHHVAHIGVALAEHGVATPVIGLALDGVGLGSDGTAWGGELLQVGPAGWQRLGHLQPLALPGGDRAARQPWRMAAAVLHALGRGDEIEARFAPRVGAAAAAGVRRLLQRGLNCPSTSSAGRWFDAAAAALGLCDVQAQEAEAAMALEALAAGFEGDSGAQARPALPMVSGVIDLRALLAELFDLAARDLAARGARLFHDTLADALAAAAIQAADRAQTATVVLGGGCFFNRLLSARVTAAVEAAGLRVLRPHSTSCGDAGLALGQAWAADHHTLRAAAAPTGELKCA